MNPFLLSMMNQGRKNPIAAILIVLVILGVLVFLYMKSPLYQLNNGLNKLIKKAFDNPFDGKKGVVQLDTGNKQVTIDEGTAQRLADSLHEAMDGVWAFRDVEVIRSIFRQMKAGDLILISNKYGMRRLTIYHWNSLGLIDALRKRLTNEEFKEIVLDVAQQARLL